MSDLMIKPRQIWYVKGVVEKTDKNLDTYITEGTRPMLVVSVHGGSITSIPMTTSETSKFYNETFKLEENSYLILSQMTTVSKNRFISKKSTLSKEIFSQVQNAIVQVLIHSNRYTPVSLKYNRGNIPVQRKAVYGKTATVSNDNIESLLKDYQDYPMSVLVKKYKMNKGKICAIVHDQFLQRAQLLS